MIWQKPLGVAVRSSCSFSPPTTTVSLFPSVSSSPPLPHRCCTPVHQNDLAPPWLRLSSRCLIASTPSPRRSLFCPLPPQSPRSRSRRIYRIRYIPKHVVASRVLEVASSTTAKMNFTVVHVVIIRPPLRKLCSGVHGLRSSLITWRFNSSLNNWQRSSDLIHLRLCRLTWYVCFEANVDSLAERSLNAYVQSGPFELIRPTIR